MGHQDSDQCSKQQSLKLVFTFLVIFLTKVLNHRNRCFFDFCHLQRHGEVGFVLLKKDENFPTFDIFKNRTKLSDLILCLSGRNKKYPFNELWGMMKSAVVCLDAVGLDKSHGIKVRASAFQRSDCHILKDPGSKPIASYHVFIIVFLLCSHHAHSIFEGVL